MDHADFAQFVDSEWARRQFVFADVYKSLIKRQLVVLTGRRQSRAQLAVISLCYQWLYGVLAVGGWMET